MGSVKEDSRNPVESSLTVFNNNDISDINKGSSNTSEISYFKGSSVDFGIIHQQDEQITDNPQKAFIIQEDKLGFHLETFVISYQAITKIVIPNKNEVLDYLRNFQDKHFCQGKELMFKHLSNLLPGSFSIEKIEDGFVYKSKDCLTLAEDEQQKLCRECENIFNEIEDNSKNVDISHYYELDPEDLDNRIKRDHVDIKAEDDLTKNDFEAVYFESEKHPIIQKNEHCKKCDAVYTTKKALQHHNKRCHSIKTKVNSDVENETKHSGKSKYSCYMCSAVFGYKRSLHRHMKQCHSVELPPLPNSKKAIIPFKSLLCEFCDKAFSAKYTYNKHLRDVHAEYVDAPERQLCAHCGKSFSTTHTYIKHLKNVHGEDIYLPEKHSMKKCPFCELEFNVSKSSYKLVRHLGHDHHHEDLNSLIEVLQLGEDGRVVCQICGEKKKNKYVLKTHIRLVHEERSHSTEVFPCKYCVKVFKYKTDAKNHMESHEPDCKKIECKECGTMFLGMFLFKKHMRNVHFQSKIKCDMCDKVLTKSKMNRHKNSVHLQFACEFCGYKFAKKHLLNDHSIKIHGIDIYMQ